jgi:hypothetical protein
MNECQLSADVWNSDNYDLKNTFAYSNNTIMLKVSKGRRDVKKSPTFNTLERCKLFYYVAYT